MVPLTPSRLGAIYTMLLEFPPFNRWKMPKPKDVEFKVLTKKDRFGDWTHDGGLHIIRVSKPKHGHLVNVIGTVAHEMVHLHQYETGTFDDGNPHNETFHEIARQICERFGFDVGQF